MSYSQPCQAHERISPSREKRTSPGTAASIAPHSFPWHSGPPWWGQRLPRGGQGARPRGRAALVGAAVAQREVLALHVEDADRAAGDLDDLPPAGWDLVDGGDDVLHSSPYSSTALR